MNGNIQTQTGVTGAKEYIVTHPVPTLGKLIWPPFGSPGLIAGYNATQQSLVDFGFNSSQNWILARAAIVKYYINKLKTGY